MFSRCIISILLLICSLSTAASAADLYPMPDEQVATAALKYRQKKYNEAWEAASQARQGGMREFMLGMSAQKLEQFDEAASHFGRAADSFPLLADYALYNQGRALFRVSRFAEASPPLQRLIKEFPESPLSRAAQQLHADVLYANRDFSNAYAAYQRFIEKFALGADAVSASYHSALCQEQMGDAAGAVFSLRNVRLRYPSSKFAAQADQDLQRLEARGNKVLPYTIEEMLQYATTLYDLKRYDEAAKTLQGISWNSQPAGTADRYLLKASQALFKAKKYKEAQAQFSVLLQKKPLREINEEALFWLAKTLDKTGREEEAVASFISLANSSANPELVDRALFEAALIKKWQKKSAEGLPFLKRILLFHPLSSLKVNATWELGWGSYQSGDMKAAAEYFKTLTEFDATREKALYWNGRALSASGDLAGARGSFSLLLAEFPFGFYSQTYEKEINVKGEEGTLQVGNFCEILPVPSGFERVKALIALGLFDEARRELSSVKKKLSWKNALPGIARLYLEMEDYNGAYNLLNNERLGRMDKNNFYQWGLCFPLAYQKLVMQSAAAHNIPESLGYAIIRSESSFSPTALSPVGAVGLMQLMPATAASISNSKGKFDQGILTNPEINIGFGMKHLQDLLALYRNDTVLAVAAYNAGAGNVNRWRKSFGGMRTDEFIENIPFAETREYVKKVLASAGVYKRLYKLADPSSAPSFAEGSKESTALQSNLPGEEPVFIAAPPTVN